MNFTEITTDRFIAYFDIMGFKDLIYRNDHMFVSRLMDNIASLVAGIKIIETNLLKKNLTERNFFEKGVVLPILFSDSIIFISESNSSYDALKTFFAASFFITKMFQNNVPIKGSIAFGTFTADFENSKFFGRPLVDAYMLSEETYFYGAVLHHSVERFLHDSLDKTIVPEQIINQYIKTKPLPMKNGTVTHSYINWLCNLTDKDPTPNILVNNLLRNVSGNIRRYVDNSSSIYCPSKSI